MKILLVGSSSSLGSALIPVLAEFNEVITAGRNNCDITIDLNEPFSNYLLPENIDVVIHAAANFGGKEDAAILEAELVNVIGTLKLCQAAVRANVKHFIFISTIFSNLPIESWFNSIYSLSKKHAEELAFFYCLKHSLPLTILKPSQIYGNKDRYGKHQPFLYTIIDKAQKGEEIIINGSHDPLRNFIYIDDLTTIISKVIQKRVEGIYSCITPVNVRFSEIVNAAFAAFNREPLMHFKNDQADIPDNIFETDSSLYQIIDYYPQTTIAEGMNKIANHRKTIS
jgi:nucleoside-diphosphate-sugar epimerase